MGIDDAILINQLAQRVVGVREGEEWFAALDSQSKRSALREINAMILQAHPIQEDAYAAIESSGLKATLTPCVLLSKPNIREQLAKVANLPEEELPRVFKLLVALLGVADKRRREGKPVDPAAHWWHADLKDPEVLAEIRHRYQQGRL